MRIRNSGILRGLSLVALLLVSSVCWQAQAAIAPAKTPSVSYKISIEDPKKQSFHVVCEVSNLKNKSVSFNFPTWSPGVYKFRVLSEAISNLQVTDGKAKAFTAKKTGQDTWEISKDETDALRIEYDLDVSGKSRFVDKNFLSETVALIKGASTFPYLVGHLDAPVSVSVQTPAGWKLISSLTQGQTTGAYTAKDFYELIDNPIMAGNFETENVSTGGATFVIAIDSQLGATPGKFSELVKKVADYQIGLFGAAPFKTYTFLIHVIPDSYFNTISSGMIGVEHERGSVISITPQYVRIIKGLSNPAQAFESIIAHEMFHSWNGKAIRPGELNKPDLQNALRSPNIWFIEGVTRYFDILSVYRANGSTNSELYESLSAIIRDGNVKKSLTDESKQAPETLSRNLYTKGALVALTLDLQIRKQTDNKRSLVDVMRALYADARQSKTYTDASLQKTIEGVAGTSLTDFFRRHVVGDEPLNVNDFLNVAGLEAIVNKEVVPQDIGIYFNRANNKIVGLVKTGAGAEAGLQPGDKVLSINNEAIETRPFQQFFTDEKIGAAYAFRILRDGKELTFEVKVRPYESVIVKIVESTNASVQQLKLRRGFLEDSAKISALKEFSTLTPVKPSTEPAAVACR